MNKIILAAFVMAIGCGGEEAAAPPAATPAPAPTPSPAPTPTTTASASASVEAPPAPKLSMAELQKKNLADQEAAWNAKDAKKLASFFAEDAVFTGFGPDGRKTLTGRAAFEEGRTKAFAMLAKTFPDMKWWKSRALQSRNVLIYQWGAAGTETGGFMGDPPSNKKAGWLGISVLWFGDDGLVKKENNYVDMWQARMQMGKGDPKAKFRPPPEPSSAPPTWIAATDSDAEKKNVELAKSLYPLFEKKDEKGYLALMSDDSVHSDQAAAEDAKGKAALKKEFAALTKAFPDLKIVPVNARGFGDIVVVETELTGTFKNALGPFKPTGKTGTLHGVDVLELKDGKIARVTTYGAGIEFAKEFDVQVPGKKDDKKKDDAKPAEKSGAKK